MSSSASGSQERGGQIAGPHPATAPPPPFMHSEGAGADARVLRSSHHRRCHARQRTQDFGPAEESDAEENEERSGRDGHEEAVVPGQEDGVPVVVEEEEEEEAAEEEAERYHPTMPPPLAPLPALQPHELPPSYPQRFHHHHYHHQHRYQQQQAHQPQQYPLPHHGGTWGGYQPSTAGTAYPPAPPPTTPLSHPVPPGEACTRLLLPTLRTGVVIGRGGKGVRSVRETTGAHVSITPAGAEDRPERYRMATVTGSVMAVCWAVELVAQKAGLFEGHSLIDPVFVSRKYSVPGWQPPARPASPAEGERERNPSGIVMVIDAPMAGFVIGKGGVTISEIRARSRARVMVLDEHESQGEGAVPGERVVLVMGNPEACRKAHQLVSVALAADHHHAHAHHQQHLQQQQQHAYQLNQHSLAQAGTPVSYFAPSSSSDRFSLPPLTPCPSTPASSSSSSSCVGISPHLPAFALPATALGVGSSDNAAATVINMGLLAHSMSHLSTGSSTHTGGYSSIGGHHHPHHLFPIYAHHPSTAAAAFLPPQAPRHQPHHHDDPLYQQQQRQQQQQHMAAAATTSPCPPQPQPTAPVLVPAVYNGVGGFLYPAPVPFAIPFHSAPQPPQPFPAAPSAAEKVSEQEEGARSSSSPALSDSSIPGTEAKAAAVGSKDEAAADAAGATCEVMVRVPSAMVAGLVGKEGGTLKRIREASGCRVTISNARPTGAGEIAASAFSAAGRMLRIQGSIEQAQHAQRLIAEEMGALTAASVGVAAPPGEA